MREEEPMDWVKSSISWERAACLACFFMSYASQGTNVDLYVFDRLLSTFVFDPLDSHRREKYCMLYFFLVVVISLFLDQLNSSQDVRATTRRTTHADPMGQNRQISDLSYRQALEGLASEHLLGYCCSLCRDSDVLQVVQHLQLSSCSRGLEGKTKGILRTSPRQMVKRMATF